MTPPIPHEHESGSSAAQMGLALGTDRRMTKQRKEVYDVLMDERDHPTATEVFMRVKERVPAISLATVYNCLETLTRCGLVKQVNMDRAPSRYCPNLKEHGHFLCESCGAIANVEFKGEGHSQALRLPRGSVVDHIEVTIKGTCPQCSKAKRPARR